MPQTLTALNVANYLLALQDEDCGDTISNLKLQKLLYYAQGFHLALTGVPLFNEPIEAWTHGPVVPVVYREFSRFGSGALPRPLDLDFSIYSAETRELLDEVHQVFGQFEAWKLRNMTHEEPPWRDATPGAVISHQALLQYFSTQIER